MCWSPKGKQLAIGSKDSKITQYKPDLKIAKVVDCPVLDGLQYPVALQWISNYQFVVIYATSKNDQCSLVVINNPKKGEITYINYEDICYSCGNTRPHQFYMYFQNLWNILLVASSNSMEVGVFGFDNDIWRQWILTDAARAELPLSATNQDTLPVGLAFDTSSSQPLPWSECTIPPPPLLLLLSNHGILCCFYAVNLKQGAAALCRSPENLNSTSTSAYFTSMSNPIEHLTKKSTPSTSNKGYIPGSGSQPNNTFSFTFNQTPNPALSVKPIQTLGTQPTLAPTSLATFDITSTNAQPLFNTNSKFATNLTESIGITGEKSELRSQIENQQNKTQPLQQITLKPTKPLAPIKPLENESDIPTDTNEDSELLITQMTKEEYVILETEFQSFVKNNRNFKISLGEDNEMINLVQAGNNLQVFLDDINPICQSQAVEIHLLKQKLIQNWAWYEDVRFRSASSKDSSFITLVQAQPLDAASSKQLEEIRHLLYYLQSQLVHANTALDEQWETFQNSCKKKLSLKLPNIEAIYQSMVTQSAIVQKQVYLLRDISNRIKTNVQGRATPHLLMSLDNNKLEEKLDKLQLSSDMDHLLQIQYNGVFERQKQLTANKSKTLIKLLKSRRLNAVGITKPELKYKTIQLNELANTLLSPIPPKKDLPLQRLNFIQSTPKVLDKQKSSVLENINDAKIQQSTPSVSLGQDLPKTEVGTELNQNKFNLVSTKLNIMPPTVPNYTFAVGEVKTSLASAFVPTAQNSFSGKGFQPSETMNPTSTNKPKNILSSTQISLTTLNDPSSVLISTVTTVGVNNYRNEFNGKPTTSTTATVPKFIFGNLSSNVTTSALSSEENVVPKINFNFTNLSRAEDARIPANASTKTTIGSISFSNNSTFCTFKPTSSNNTITSASNPLLLPTGNTGVTTAISPNTALSNSSLTFSKSFETSLPNNYKIAPNMPFFTLTNLTTTATITTASASVITPIGVNTQFTPLSNRIGISTNITPSSQSGSAVSTTSNLSLDLTIANIKKGSPSTSFSSGSTIDDSKTSVSSERITVVDDNTIIPASTATPVSLFSPTTASLTFRNFTTESIFSNSQTVSTTSAPQTIQPSFGSSQQLAGRTFFGSPQPISSTVLIGTQKSITTSSNSPVTTSTSAFELSKASLFANNSGTVCTTTTTSSIFGSNNVINTTKSPLFSTGTVPASTTGPKSSQGSIFDMNTNTKIQTPHFETSPNSTIFSGKTNVPNTTGNTFDISSSGPLLPNSTGTSISVFASTPTFTSGNTNSTGFFVSTNSATPAFGQNVTFGSTSIFSSPTTTNSGNIFGNSSTVPANAFTNTIVTTSSTPFGTAFGSTGNNSNIFGSSTDSFRFPATTGTSTSSGNFGFTGKTLFTSFGNTASSTNTTTPNFGNLSLTTTSGSFGSGFSQNLFSRPPNPEEKSPFSGGSLFSSPVTTTSSSNIFPPTSSPFNKSAPAFGAPALFGQAPAFGNQNSSFGQTSFGANSNVFGSSAQPTSFSGNSVNMNQSSFAAAPVFGSSFGATTPGGFGAPPSFGSPVFSQNVPYVNPTKPFSATFGSSCQENPTFANLA
ncbi:hypothetical protein AMK59_5498, partial [Oryctes borbonicus]